MANSPFTTPILRDWLLDQLEEYPLEIELVSTMGSGPFQEDEFDDFLESLGIEAYPMEENTEVLILGEEDWSSEVLRDMLSERSGETLRVYSQEMFLSFILSGADPLDEDEEVLRAFGEEHPALEFLSAAGFHWPTSTVIGGGGSELQAEWLAKGYLKSLGYTVGQKGLTDSERREILASAYSATVPNIFPEEYRETWGRPRSSLRLQKMAESIATFCRNAQRRPHAMQLAISQWEKDLDWLHDAYYEDRYIFEWPSTTIW
jgi:hypothetical protein